MSIMSIRATIKPSAVEDLESAAKAMFEAIERQQPTNIRYASCRLADGVTYLIILQVDDGTENPLPALPEFRQFQAGLQGWAAGPPEGGPVEVVGSYRFF